MSPNADVLSFVELTILFLLTAGLIVVIPLFFRDKDE